MFREYSAFRLFLHAFGGHKNWRQAWRQPALKPEYDAIIIGGGGHGLATAYYLAKEHNLRKIAVLEKGLIGSGNVGRNTTIVRSNYLLDGNTQFYEWSVKLWEGLSHDLNYNVMFSQRGVLNLAHTPSQLDSYARRGNAMRACGIDAELLDLKQVKDYAPYLDTTQEARFPIAGGLLQKRGGTARHDAVAWGFARACDRLGVDIIQNCEVTDFIIEDNKIKGVITNKGKIKTAKVGMALAGNTTTLADKAGLRLPIESHLLQAFVSEGIKPWFHHVITYGAGHFYMSQSDKGGLVYGGDLDSYNSYAARGNLPVVDTVSTIAKAMMPAVSRIKMLRHWGGIMDMSLDGSPIIDKTSVEGLYLNGGWCYGGFKATPASGWCFAHTIAQDKRHKLNDKFTLQRFENGAILNENGHGPFAWEH